MPKFIENDPALLAGYITSVAGGLIVFDGRPLAGKTHLAREMAKRLLAPPSMPTTFLITTAGVSRRAQD